MGSLTGNEINALVRAAKDSLADAIEAQATGNIGVTDPIEFDVHIKIGLDDTQSANYEGVEKCIYICYVIGGDIRCFRYCFKEPL